jgi:hypothetical protein
MQERRVITKFNPGLRAGKPDDELGGSNELNPHS